MLKMGLTGGIASGKSAVAAMLREMGFPVLEADVVAHKLLEPGQAAHDEVLREFGAELADAAGKIDRAKLGALVFADPAKLAKLNRIIHPRVEEIILQKFEEWKQSGVRDAGFVEAALLGGGGDRGEAGRVGGGVLPAGAADGTVAGAGNERDRGKTTNGSANAGGGKVAARDRDD